MFFVNLLILYISTECMHHTARVQLCIRALRIHAACNMHIEGAVHACCMLHAYVRHT